MRWTMSKKKKAAGTSGGTSKPDNSTYNFRTPETITDAIDQYSRNGLSLVPIDSNNKRPVTPLLPLDDIGNRSWSPLQCKGADQATLSTWKASDLKAIAVIGGEVSGGLCVIDFDVPRFY